MLPDIDLYEMEYSQFEWDVHILIEGTLEASILGHPHRGTDRVRKDRGGAKKTLR